MMMANAMPPQVGRGAAAHDALLRTSDSVTHQPRKQPVRVLLALVQRGWPNFLSIGAVCLR